jgi:hypothetical protein
VCIEIDTLAKGVLYWCPSLGCQYVNTTSSQMSSFLRGFT